MCDQCTHEIPTVRYRFFDAVMLVCFQCRKCGQRFRIKTRLVVFAGILSFFLCIFQIYLIQSLGWTVGNFGDPRSHGGILEDMLIDGFKFMLLCANIGFLDYLLVKRICWKLKKGHSVDRYLKKV